MSVKQEYTMSHSSKINSNCDVEFNWAPDDGLHIKIVTFKGKKSVVLSEKTLTAICKTLKEYQREVLALDSVSS